MAMKVLNDVEGLFCYSFNLPTLNDMTNYILGVISHNSICPSLKTEEITEMIFLSLYKNITTVLGKRLCAFVIVGTIILNCY